MNPTWKVGHDIASGALMRTRSAVPEGGSPPDTAERTFRVVTAEDFGTRGGQGGGSKRTLGLPSSACNTCRLRKVKCNVNIDAAVASARGEPSTTPTCQACRHSNIECRWDTIDGRKRRKLRRGSDGGNDAPAVEAVASAADNEKDPLEDGRPEATPAADLDGFSAWQPIFQDFGSPGNLDVPFDWSDIQDFVFDPSIQDIPDTISEHSGRGSRSDAARAALAKAPKAVQLLFYRRFGPTAIAPGFRKLPIAIGMRQLRTAAESPRENRTPSAPGSTPCTASQGDADQTDYPYDLSPDSIERVLDVFFQHYRGHFPFVDPQILAGHARAGQASSFLINTITALTARFCSFDVTPTVASPGGDEPWRRGAPYLKRAKEQLVSLMGFPAADSVAGLLILAWAEFGDNNETGENPTRAIREEGVDDNSAGLWMFSGMAIRMAQDLGLHKTTTVHPSVLICDRALSPDGKVIFTDEEIVVHQQRATLVLFWSAFITDVCVSLLTGRPPTLRLSEIEVAAPTAQDMKITQVDVQEKITLENMVFPEVVQFMLLFSEAVELLNLNQNHGNCAKPDAENERARIRLEIMKRYQSLPPELVFNSRNYDRASSSGFSGLFLMLHLYFYTFMTLLTRRSDGQDPGRAAKLGTGELQQPGTVLVSSQKVVQLLQIAELINKHGYLSTPFTQHCLFVPASMILKEYESNRSSADIQDSQDFLSLVGLSDLQYLNQKLQEQSQYFKGISTTLAALDRRRRELNITSPEGIQDTPDDEPEDDEVTVDELGDGGIMNRYVRYNVPGT